MQDISAAQQIDGIISKHGGWKAQILTELRQVITSTSKDIEEEVKWKMPTRPEGLPVWSCQGIVCFAEIWMDNIKLIFTKGALLSDPNGLFNARLKSKTDRAIEFHEGDSVSEPPLKQLVLEGIAFNKSKSKRN